MSDERDTEQTPDFIVSTTDELLKGLAEARPGDTIELRPGIYELDSPVTIGKSVILISYTQPEA